MKDGKKREPINGTPHQFFSWQKLNEIALTIAQGIDYLHRRCNMQMLHFDIKPITLSWTKLSTQKFQILVWYLLVWRKERSIWYITPELVSRSFGVIFYKSDIL